MALRQRRPVVMLTSDIDDMTKLCGNGDKVRLVAVQSTREPAVSNSGSGSVICAAVIAEAIPAPGR